MSLLDTAESLPTSSSCRCTEVDFIERSTNVSFHVDKQATRIRVDELACVGRGRSWKASAWMRKPVWAMLVKRNCPYGQVGLCGP